MCACVFLCISDFSLKTYCQHKRKLEEAENRRTKRLRGHLKVNNEEVQVLEVPTPVWCNGNSNKFIVMMSVNRDPVLP